MVALPARMVIKLDTVGLGKLLARKIPIWMFYSGHRNPILGPCFSNPSHVEVSLCHLCCFAASRSWAVSAVRHSVCVSVLTPYAGAALSVVCPNPTFAGRSSHQKSSVGVWTLSIVGHSYKRSRVKLRQVHRVTDPTLVMHILPVSAGIKRDYWSDICKWGCRRWRKIFSHKTTILQFIFAWR